MSLNEFQAGLVIASPVMGIAGLAFAVSISMNPYVAMAGKALGWPLSIIAGYVGGVHWGAALLPSWDEWARTLTMFGVGWFLSWMCIGIMFHQDTIVHELNFAKFVLRRMRAFVASQKKSGSTPKYKAYAKKPDDHT